MQTIKELIDIASSPNIKGSSGHEILIILEKITKAHRYNSDAQKELLKPIHDNLLAIGWYENDSYECMRAYRFMSRLMANEINYKIPSYVGIFSKPDSKTEILDLTESTPNKLNQ